MASTLICITSSLSQKVGAAPGAQATADHDAQSVASPFSRRDRRVALASSWTKSSTTPWTKPGPIGYLARELLAEIPAIMADLQKQRANAVETPV